MPQPDDTPADWSERSTLLAMLHHTRATAVRTATALGSAASGTAPLATSPLMTAGGVLNHLRWVEHWWIEHVFLGRPDEAPWTDDDPDREFRLGAELPLDEVIDGYRAQSERLDAELAGTDLDLPAAEPVRDGRQPTLRWVLLHLIEENARHNGQLDILGELVAGRPVT